MTEHDEAARLALEADEMHRKLLAKAMLLARELGLTNEDRHELSIMVVGADRTKSWGKMTLDQISRVCDYLLGFHYIATILRDRVTGAGINARAAAVVRNPGQERDG